MRSLPLQPGVHDDFTEVRDHGAVGEAAQEADSTAGGGRQQVVGGTEHLPKQAFRIAAAPAIGDVYLLYIFEIRIDIVLALQDGVVLVHMHLPHSNAMPR